jgi:hypothetical protein
MKFNICNNIIETLDTPRTTLSGFHSYKGGKTTHLLIVYYDVFRF